MKKVPRASLSVDLLTDGCYGALVSTEAGLQAFGVFVALVVAARERLLRGRAARVQGTDTLRFDDDTSHICRLTHVPPRRFAAALETLAEVAQANGERPWVFADAESRLNIRSYFKFNDPGNWGGSRPGAGRPNQDEIKLNSSRDQVGPAPSASASALALAEPTVQRASRDVPDLNRIDEGPPEWQAVIAKAKSLWGTRRFPEALRESFGTSPHANGALMHWWEMGTPEAFVAALVDLRAKPDDWHTVDRFCAFVRREVNKPTVRVAQGTTPGGSSWTPEEEMAHYARLEEQIQAEMAAEAARKRRA